MWPAWRCRQAARPPGTPLGSAALLSPWEGATRAAGSRSLTPRIDDAASVRQAWTLLRHVSSFQPISLYLSLSIYLSMYLSLFIYLSIYLSIDISLSLSLYIYIYIHYTCVMCMYVSMYVFIYACMYVCMYACMHAFIYVFICLFVDLFMYVYVEPCIGSPAACRPRFARPGYLPLPPRLP